MQLWLLAAGAALLVALAAWVVWPLQPEEMISMSSNPQTPDPQDIPPQGDRFEAQYTSATGDLSAGGVAEAFAQAEPPGPNLTEPAPETPGQNLAQPAAETPGPTLAQPAADTPDRYAPPPVATAASTGEPGSHPTLPREGTGDRFQTPVPTSHAYPGAPVVSERSMPGIIVPAAAALTVGGAVAGAWLYAWWQERNKPVNRLRRRARDVAHHLPDVASRLPDMDDLPSGAGPKGGAAAVVLLTSLALARALRSGAEDEEPEVDQDAAEEQRQRALHALDRLPWRELLASVDWSNLLQGVPSADDVRGRGKRLLHDGPSVDDVRGRARRFVRDLPDTDDLRKRGQRVARRLPSVDDLQDESARPAVFGLGFGGVAAVLAASYLVWRVLRGT